MRVLLANLKHFYQCRPLWFFYICMGVVIWPGLVLARMGVDLGVQQGYTLSVIVWPLLFVAGAIVCLMQFGTASRPFAFTLPGHRQVVRRLVFGAGFLAGLLGAGAFASHYVPPDAPPNRFGLALFAVFCVGLSIYLVGANLGLSRAGLVVAGLLWPFLCLATIFPSLSGTMEDLIVGSPWLVITSGTGIATILSLWLGRQLASLRSVHERRAGLVGMSERSRRDVCHGALTACESDDAALTGTCRIFLDFVRDPRRTDIAKQLAFTLYPWLLAHGPGRAFLLLRGLMAFGYMFLIWYIPSSAATFLLLLSMLASMDVCDDLPLYSPALISGGRRERFFATMAHVIVRAGMLALFAILSYAVVYWLRPPRPELLAFLYEEAPRLDIRCIVLLMALFPVASLLAIGVHAQSRLWLVAALMLLYVPASVPISLLFQFKYLTSIPLAWVVGVTILSWAICTYGVYRIAMWSDLGRR